MITPGIHTLSNEDYHASAGVSKTGLFTLYKKTPYHFRFSEHEETEGQKFGSAAHTAVLEPNLFEPRYTRGPADRRGNKWTSAVEIAAATGRTVLTEDDYDDALRLRDAIHRDPDVRKLTAGAPAIEQSAYWNDPATGELIRCRPDIYSHDLGVMADLKATVDASPWQFSKRVDEFGYHCQEAIYSEGWQAAGGGPVNAFLFITVEKKSPFAYKLYELEPSAVVEGQAIYRQALEQYHASMTLEREVRARYGAKDGPDIDAALRDCWPMYGQGVGALDLPAYGYRLTKRESDDAAS
jgi:hypothetical protein